MTTVTYLLATLLALTAMAALALLWQVYAARRAADQLRQQLARQQKQAQALLDALPFPVTVKDQHGTYRMLNAACQRDCGVDAQAIGQTSLALPACGLFAGGNGASKPLFHEASLQALHGDDGQQREIAYTDSNGSPRVGVWWDCPIRVDDGPATGTLGVLVDITRFRDAEREARRTELSLREITQRVAVVMFTVRRSKDRRYRLAFLTGDLHALFGLQAQDVQRPDQLLQLSPLLDRVHPEDQADVRQALRQAMGLGRARALDFRAYGAEGLRWIHLVLAPRLLPDGEVHWSGYLIDTTSINTRNEALRAARDAAERASKAKADFLATMSHEIRTPMNGVIGMLELLGHTRLDAEQHELLRTVEDSASVLLQILNDVLDFSKLESGSLRLDLAPFDPRRLLDSVAGVMATHLHKKGLRIQVLTDATLAGRLRGDSIRLQQLLLNLLNNASKFTEQGGVTVSMRVLGDDGVSQRLRLSVADTGIGIPADKQGHLFTPFTQAESWTTRRYGGTGLGLAICRHLVQLMGGEIRLESEPGAGTTITIELQLPIESRNVERPTGLNGRHAIVRLASAETAAALTGNLQALGLTVEQIPPAQKLRTGLAANLLFIDADDQQSAEAIAAQAIIVNENNTASGDPFVQDEHIHLDANPLSWKGVTRACVLGLEPHSAQPRETPPLPAALPMPAADKRPAAHRQGRILIAEDHPVSQALVQRQLDLLGWPCDIVGDGRSAYAALLGNDYAMLMTDCQMPLMSGYELATAWRQHEASQGAGLRMPIVAMTASALDGEMARCREAGMDDYLSKPVQLRQLGEKIDAWMPLAAAPAAPVSGRNDDALAELFAEPGDDVVRSEMLRLLIDTSRTDLLQLDLAIAAGDASVAGRQLHRVLGALQLFSNDHAISEGRQWLEELKTQDAAAMRRELPAYVATLRKLLAGLEHSIHSIAE